MEAGLTHLREVGGVGLAYERVRVCARAHACACVCARAHACAFACACVCGWVGGWVAQLKHAHIWSGTKASSVGAAAVSAAGAGSPAASTVAVFAAVGHISRVTDGPTEGLCVVVELLI